MYSLCGVCIRHIWTLNYSKLYLENVHDPQVRHAKGKLRGEEKDHVKICQSISCVVIFIVGLKRLFVYNTLHFYYTGIGNEVKLSIIHVGLSLF